MKTLTLRLCSFAILALLPLAVQGEPASPTPGAPAIDYSRDILPILSNKCYACHGPAENARKAGLRLDVRDVALKSGAIAPGKPADSELLRRIHSGDPKTLMPPAKSNKSLTTAEKDLLQKWIAAGAEYRVHWSLQKPGRPAPPGVKDTR